MQLRNVRYVLDGHIRSRAVLVQLVFAAFGISVGVALLFGSQISSTSLTRSAGQLDTTKLVGSAQLQIDARGPEGFPEAILHEVRGQTGVIGTLPILERQVNVIGRSGERSVDLIGVEPSSLSSTIPLLRQFSAKLLNNARGVALPEPLVNEINAGAAVRLQVGARFVRTLVATTLTAADIGGLIHSPVALTSIHYAQRMTRSEHRLTRIFVHYQAGDRAEVRHALTQIAARSNINLHPANFDKTLFSVAVTPESESEMLFSGISALVGFMFALNAMLVTIPARRKLIADLREEGADLTGILQVLLADAVLMGFPACALGLLFGDALSIGVFHTQPGYLAFAFPVGNARIVTLKSAAVAVTVGMTATVFGVLWPVKHILGRRIRAPHEWALTRKLHITLIAVGVVCLAATTVILIGDTGAAIVGNATLILALVTLLPLLFEGLLRVFGYALRILAGLGAEGAIDELNAPQTRVRSLAIAGLAAIAVFGVVEFQGVATNLQHGLDASATNLDSNADIWITPRGSSSLLSTIGFEPLDTSQLSQVQGVTNVGIYRGSFLDWGKRRLWVLAPASSSRSLVPTSQLLTSGAGLASARLRGGGWALLSQAAADEYHLHVGAPFTLPSPRPLSLRLAGVTTNLGWPPGAVILNAADYGNGWEANNPSAYEIQTARGAPVAVIRARLSEAVRSQPGLVVETAHEREQRHYALAAQGLARLTQIRHLVLVCAILALIAAMSSLLWQRRDRIAFNRSNGIPELVLWRSLVWESAILLTAGSLIGAVWGLYAQLLGSRFLATVTGFPIVFNIEGVAAITGFALVSLTAVAILAVPGYFAVGVRAKSVSPAY